MSAPTKPDASETPESVRLAALVTYSVVVTGSLVVALFLLLGHLFEHDRKDPDRCNLNSNLEGCRLVYMRARDVLDARERMLAMQLDADLLDAHGVNTECRR